MYLHDICTLTVMIHLGWYSKLLLARGTYHVHILNHSKIKKGRWGHGRLPEGLFLAGTLFYALKLLQTGY